MNSYSNASKERLGTCHRDLQLIFETVLEQQDHMVQPDQLLLDNVELLVLLE